MTTYHKTTNCKVFSIHVIIDDIATRAHEMIETLSNMSWIHRLDIVPRISYEARAERTIEKLVNSILNNIVDTMNTEFGEFLISVTAQDSLNHTLNHIKVPLAELLKEKVSGNPGFDFHTESHTQLISFGEAKYSGSDNMYREAMEQISSFVILKKDLAEVVDLQYFVSPAALNNIATNNKKAFVAAFSINSKNPTKIFYNALSSTYIDDLLIHDELYLIGIEVSV